MLYRVLIITVIASLNQPCLAQLRATINGETREISSAEFDSLKQVYQWEGCEL